MSLTALAIIGAVIFTLLTLFTLLMLFNPAPKERVVSVTIKYIEVDPETGEEREIPEPESERRKRLKIVK
ncbi:hypothetical protein [Paenibacillus xylanexedens]|uniref:hypothetical protein n=1 Tax=Paenibacillus xylanexedens TaxID=528191 RepID=UPI0011A77AB1|nr:hypothetical protein [Paenibacillus xylanexedens]